MALCQMLGWGKKEKGLNKFKKLQIKKLKQIRFSSLTYQNVGIRKFYIVDNLWKLSTFS